MKKTTTIAYAKWISDEFKNSVYFSKNRIYLIIDVGSFPKTVKFINDFGDEDEADVSKFQLSNRSAYNNQQKEIENLINK